MVYVYDRVGENAGYQRFLLFPQCFQSLSFSGSFKVVIVWANLLVLLNIISLQATDIWTNYTMTFCFFHILIVLG